MQICQGTAEINGIALHYNSTKNLTLCWYKFTGRFMKISIYVHIHHTWPVDWFVWIQLPATKVHSSSVHVAAGLSHPSVVPHAATYRLTKSVLTLLFHKLNRLSHKIPKFNSEAVPSVLLDSVQICWFSSSRIYPHEFRLVIQLPQLDVLACVSSVIATPCVCVFVCAHVFIVPSKWAIIQIIIN